MWALSQSSIVDAVVATPGNPGIAAAGLCLSLNDAMESLDSFDLAVIGPEAPLVDGMADEMREQGLAVFGPSAAAARLEGSKAWMKDVLADAEIPTARHATVTGAQEDAALAYLETLPGLYVIKTDGLAAPASESPPPVLLDPLPKSFQNLHIAGNRMVVVVAVRKSWCPARASLTCP